MLWIKTSQNRKTSVPITAPERFWSRSCPCQKSPRGSQVKERLRHAGKEKGRSDVICGMAAKTSMTCLGSRSPLCINYNNNETLLIFNTIILLYLRAPDNQVYIYSRFISTYFLCFHISSVLEYVRRVFCSCWKGQKFLLLYWQIIKCAT